MKNLILIVALLGSTSAFATDDVERNGHATSDYAKMKPSTQVYAPNSVPNGPVVGPSSAMRASPQVAPAPVAAKTKGR